MFFEIKGKPTTKETQKVHIPFCCNCLAIAFLFDIQNPYVQRGNNSHHIIIGIIISYTSFKTKQICVRIIYCFNQVTTQVIIYSIQYVVCG